MTKDTIMVGGGENKLLAYVDISGVSEFYKKKKKDETREIAKKISYGFLGALQEIREDDRMSIHIMSDSAFLVPHNSIKNIKNKKSIIDKVELVEICLKLFENMVERTQKLEYPNLSRILITRGSYYYIENKKGEHSFYTIGGHALVKCVEADKREGLPFGVFTDCPDIEILFPTPLSTWQFVNHRRYLSKQEYEGFEYITERLLSDIINKRFSGWDKTSEKLRRYCETLPNLINKIWAL